MTNSSIKQLLREKSLEQNTLTRANHFKEPNLATFSTMRIGDQVIANQTLVTWPLTNQKVFDYTPVETSKNKN